MYKLGRFIIFTMMLGACLAAQTKLKWSDISDVNLLKPAIRTERWLDAQRFLFWQDKKLVSQHISSSAVNVVLDPAQMEAVKALGISPTDYEDVSADFMDLLYLHNDDIYHYNYKNKRLVRLTDTPALEKNPTLSPDRRMLAYTRDGNLYIRPLTPDGSEKALTSDGNEEILNGYASWIYYEEILGRQSNYRAFWWSPDSRYLVFYRFDQSMVRQFPIFWHTDVYGKLEMQRYPKPGMPNPEVSIHVVDMSNLQQTTIDIPQSQGNYLAFPRFSPHSSGLLYVQWLNRHQNQLKLYVNDLSHKTQRLAYQESQQTWIDFLEETDLEFLPNEQILLRSSKDGWFHLYLLDGKGRERQLTKGPWSVEAIERVVPESGRVIFSAFKEDSTRKDLYEVNLQTSGLKRLTKGAGSHASMVSTDGRHYIDNFSSLSQPSATYLVTVKNGKQKLLADTISEKFKTLQLGPNQLIRVPTPDGLLLPVSYILPADYKPGQSYPMILGIYGGPGARGVSDSFPRGFYNFYLAQQGIVVVSADHRGAGHHGKIGMNAMHRQLGKWEMADYGAVVDYFVSKGIADPARVGITGGSYGGYVTALALTQGSVRFKFGIASSSVTDWRLYDSVYTERFMDTPEQNPDGYKESSVLSHVDTYQGGLLITHGMMDDNVHMQNTIQLIDKMQDALKPVQLMLFPPSRHGFRGPKREANRQLETDFWLRSFFGKPFVKKEDS